VCVLAALFSLLLLLLLASEEETKEESFEEILDRVLRWRTILRISCPLVRTHYHRIVSLSKSSLSHCFFLFDLQELVSSFEVCDTP
jgi:hypothetical protein